MDYTLYRAVNGLTGQHAVDAVFKAISAAGPAVMVVLVALLFFRGRRMGAVTGTLAAAVAVGIAQPIAHAVDRVRPYVAHPHHAHLLIPASHDPSFPSDHAVGAFALAFGVWAYDRAWGAVLIVLATLLSFARVFVGTHYPGDVAGGALLAAAVVAVATHLTRLATRKRVGQTAHP